jgi:hypothetical protein
MVPPGPRLSGGIVVGFPTTIALMVRASRSSPVPLPFAATHMAPWVSSFGWTKSFVVTGAS